MRVRSAKLREEMPPSEQEAERCDSFGLTRTELNVVRRLVAGYTNEEIADDLATSGEVVNRHIASILSKLHASNPLDIVLFAVFHQLADELKLNDKWPRSPKDTSLVGKL